jgi:UDP-N-acetylglucosamine 2-epimerase (non-hydrolysing)
VHRQSNVDTPQTLRGLLSALYTISQRIPVIFPIHPRTRQRISEFGLDIQEEESLRFIDPVSYIDFLNLMINARLVVTDSGGIQEETTVLGIKCLTLRNNTERPITVTQGTNRLAGITQESVTREALLLLEQPQPEPASIELWDGKTAERIINVLCQGATKV